MQRVLTQKALLPRIRDSLKMSACILQNLQNVCYLLSLSFSPSLSRSLSDYCSATYGKEVRVVERTLDLKSRTCIPIADLTILTN